MPGLKDPVVERDGEVVSIRSMLDCEFISSPYRFTVSSIRKDGRRNILVGGKCYS